MTQQIFPFAKKHLQGKNQIIIKMARPHDLFVDMEEYMKIAQKVNVIFELEKPLGYFSVTPERFYRGDASQLRLVEYPQPDAFPLDLTAPLECRYRKWLNHFYDEYLDNLLCGICDHRSQLLLPHGYEGNHGWRVQASIVCQMQVLQTLMCTPYKQNESWLILAINYRDTLYLCLENPGEQPWSEERMKKSAMETWLEHKVYKGYNEHVAKNVVRAPPEECSDFNYILRSRFNDLSVLYSAPILGGVSLNSGPLTDAEIMNMQLLECKLGRNRRRMDGRLFTDLYSSEEALKWWSESQLKGVKNILLGLANPYGRVQKLEPISCEKFLKDNKINWSADLCQQFLSQFLDQVRERMRTVDDYGTIYEFNYVAQTKCIYWNQGTGQRLSFIPEWYRRILEDTYTWVSDESGLGLFSAVRASPNWDWTRAKEIPRTQPPRLKTLINN